MKRLNDTEKKLKERKEKDYINLDVSNEEREKGNEVLPGFLPHTHSLPAL